MSVYKLLQPEVWQSLTSTDVRLPHALLFAGPAGVGQRELADALAARLLCEQPRESHQPACGQCPSCQMIATGNHPDLRLLQPDAASEGEEGEIAGENEKKKASKQIRIAQVRDLEAFFNLGGHRDGARVCIIEPAESMNAVTANALLKILEEPSASFYFLLISYRWRRLLPTLLSRSRRVMFGSPDPTAASAWLEHQQLGHQSRWLAFFDHAPLEVAHAARSGRLKALDTLITDLLKPQDPLAQAARWESLVKNDSALGMEELVTTVQKWLLDLARSIAGEKPRYLPSHEESLRSVAQRTSLNHLVQAQQQVQQLRAWANHPLNPRLFLEDLSVRAFRPFNT